MSNISSSAGTPTEIHSHVHEHALTKCYICGQHTWPAMGARLCMNCGYWSRDGQKLRLRMSTNLVTPKAPPKPDLKQIRCKHGRYGHNCASARTLHSNSSGEIHSSDK